jgi:putative heme-binding domain-containing protein
VCLLAFGLTAAGQPRTYSATDVANGKQLFSIHCQPCHGPDGDQVQGVDMRRGQFKRVSSDTEIAQLILNGVPGTGMPPTNLPEPSRIAIVAFIRSLGNTSRGAGPGDASRGREVFEGKGGCLSCHRVADRGSRKGPDLSEIGRMRSAEVLERSILEPNETLLPQERYVRAVTKDGKTITGMRLNEDTHNIMLIDENERLVALAKSDLRECTLLKTSPMPSYKGKLDSQEIADVVSYLLTLKGMP